MVGGVVRVGATSWPAFSSVDVFSRVSTGSSVAVSAEIAASGASVDLTDCRAPRPRDP